MKPPTKTDAYLYAQKRLGLGDYDDIGDSRFWWEYQRSEVGKLSVAMKRKAATPEQVMTVVDYCVLTRQKIGNVFNLMARFNDALRWASEQQKVDQLEVDLLAAIEAERALEDSPWLTRLLRARGEARAGVLAEWKESRASTPATRSA